MMKMGIFLRNFGPPSTAPVISECARAAESMGLDALWVSDHIAIPPQEAEGSGGRYLDPLATLAWLAAITEHISIGTSVLIVPYRPALVTAKWLASIQELSGGRLSVGASVGWMEAEFRAAGVDRRQRGRITDETLAFWRRCFENDEVEASGQRFLFRPRPARPPFYIGGAAPHALHRAVALGDGWMPAEGDPDKLREPVAELQRLMSQAGKPAPQVIPLTALPLDQPDTVTDQLTRLAEIGVTGIDHAGRYETVDEFKKTVEQLLQARQRAGLD